MRLHSFVPALPPVLVHTLEDHNIKTDTELLFSGSTIELLAKLPPGTVGLAALSKYTELVAERTSAPGVRGDEELEQVLANQHADAVEIAFGVGGLDAFVGGFEHGRVFEISGEKASGKSELALQTVLRILSAYPEAAGLWIDTCGDFSAERTFRVAKELGVETPSATLERLQVSPILNVQAAQDSLEELRLTPAIRCVVIDSITPLFAPLLSPFSAQGHATMTNFMQDLRNLARTNRLAVFVTNNTATCMSPRLDSAFASSTRKPALGPSFTFLTDCTLWLSKNESADDGDGRSSVHVEVLRSRMMVRLLSLSVRHVPIGVCTFSNPKRRVRSKFAAE